MVTCGPTGLRAIWLCCPYRQIKHVWQQRMLPYRNYYDIYSLLQAGYSFEDGLDYALKFTRHPVHSKAVLSALITPTLYPKPQDFDLMQPKYAVSPEEMANYFMEVIASRKK